MAHTFKTEVIKGISHFSRGPAYGVKVWRDGKPFHFERFFDGRDGRTRRALAVSWAKAVNAKGLVGYPCVLDTYIGTSFPESERKGWSN